MIVLGREEKRKYMVFYFITGLNQKQFFCFSFWQY
jgi:hypothetical protein